MTGPPDVGMRAACAAVIGDVVASADDVVALGADGHALFTCVIEFAPDRYVDVGIAEANLISVAAGLARSGWRPIVGAMAPFITRRAYEQMRLDVALPGLPVVVLGVGGGLSYGPLGPTHHAVDDLTLMSALPNMRLYCPADAVDAAHVLRRCLPAQGPTYVRLTARPDPVVFAESDAASLDDPGSVRLIREGADALVIATGRCVAEALAAADECAAHGAGLAVAVVTCLRPFPMEGVRTLAGRWPVLITVAEALGESGLATPVTRALVDRVEPIVHLNIDHRYPPVASHQELLAYYGVDRSAICAAALKGINMRGVS